MKPSPSNIQESSLLIGWKISINLEHDIRSLKITGKTHQTGLAGLVGSLADGMEITYHLLPNKLVDWQIVR